MTRPEQPRYFVKQKTLYEDFATVGDFTVSSGGTLTADTTYVKNGTASLRATTGLGQRLVFGWAIDELMTIKKDNMLLYFYLPEDPTDSGLDYIEFGMTTEEPYNNTNYFKKSISVTWHPFLLKQGWNVFPVQPNVDWSTIGTISWDSVMKTMFLKVNAKTGKTPVVIFDSLWAEVKRKPLVLLTFDDGYANQYTNGLPILVAKGCRATAYIVQDWIGTANYMTAAQLKEMDDAGVTVANHTKSHMVLSGKTYSQVESEIGGCTNYLLSLGLTRGAYHVAYPGGNQDDNVLAVMAALGMKTGRTVATTDQYPIGGKPYNMSGISLGSGTTLATAKGYIDAAITKGTIATLLFHQITDTVGVYSWKMADFSALLDYINQRGVKTLTIDEYYEGLINPRYRSIPLTRSAV